MSMDGFPDVCRICGKDTCLGGCEEPLRCIVTKNPCGTDTVIRGRTCPCFNCQLWARQRSPVLSEAEERAAFLEDAQKNGYDTEIINDTDGWNFANDYTGERWAGWLARARKESK